MELAAAALSSIGDGVILTDRTGTVLYVNDAGERLTGRSGDEAAGRRFGEIFPLVDFYTGTRLDDPVEAALGHGRPVGLQNRSALVTKGGETLFISASCSPILMPGGGTEGVVVVFRDINRIKGLEEEIKKEKDNLRNVLESLPTGIALVDGDLAVKWVNGPLLDLFGMKEESIVGQRFGDGSRCVYSLEKRCGEGDSCRFCEIRQNIGLVVRDNESRKEVELKRSFMGGGGEVLRWLRISLIPLAVSGGSQIVIAIEDISGQKEYEAALQKSRDEAESASRVKGEFLANMSHEIRTPLNGLIGMMDLLSQTDTDTEQAEYIRMAKLSADNLFKVINDILDFSRIEAGKVSISSVSFDILALMDEVVKIHAVLAERKGLELKYTVPSGVPRHVVGDPDRLRQVLNNLIGNAVKFTDAGYIAVELRQTSRTEQGSVLEFAVSDTGIGISAEKMNLLFKRFSQADSSVTRRYSGTGLGLAICRQLVELMGGEIRAESEPGKGSRFSFSLSFACGNSDTSASPHGPETAAERLLPPIIMNGAEYGLHVPEKSADGAERIVIVENRAGPGGYGHVRLDENGEVVFGADASSEEDKSGGTDSLREALRRLRNMILEERLPFIEEAAHGVRQAALLAGADELAELAFKSELAARKQRWDLVTEYCLKMIDAFTILDSRENMLFKQKKTV